MEKNTTVRQLAQIDTGHGTIGGEKADYVWEAACDNMDMSVVEFCGELGQYVSDSHVRKVLKELPPEAFGI